MTYEEFLQDTHFDNFPIAQLQGIIDFNVVSNLDVNQFNTDQKRWLSQYLIGNVSEPMNDIMKLSKAEQFNVFDTWFDLIRDEGSSKRMARHILYHLLNA